ncbi:MAG TPA: LysM domain-containing protein [Candidatus Limnocylindrales bacterium]|nr:LysM domain-containing protein [Candidatus Limnocylindrales bacterium]
MTERGLPLADGAPACPFVAFEDDRDERASVPDHRHRCYADQRPAPRALAHQEAYCLSSAFPVCPTFQDWARREAARSRDGAPTAPSASAGMNRAATGAVADADAADAASAGAAGVGGAAGIAGAAGAGASGPAAGLADTSRDVRRTVDVDDSHADDLVRRNPPRDWAAPPPWLASNEPRGRGDAEPPAFLGHRVTEPGQGLAGSPADRLAGGPPPRRDESDDVNWSSESRSAAAIGAGLAGGGAEPGPRRRSVPASDGEQDDDGEARPARRPRAYAQHLGGPDGPDWEQPRRYEAYPTIKARVGLPAVPRIVGVAALVAVLALALFFLPGMLNIGGGTATPGGSPGASLRPGPSVSLAPTEQPAATPIIYTIKHGDVLSKIAAAHGITLEQLMAANPTIKNPNKISEGQQITIPLPSAAPPDTIDGSAAP